MEAAQVSPLGRALGFYKYLYAVLAAYFAVIVAQSFYLGVPLSDFSEVGTMLLISTIKFLFFMGFLALLLLTRKDGRSGFGRTVSGYIESDVFAFGICGLMFMIPASVLFVIQKCYIPYFVPFSWDPLFAGWDALVHFGRVPQDYLISIVEKFPVLADIFQYAYSLWFFAVYLCVAYCLFCDRNLQRRMQLIWTYFLCFVVVGGFLATLLSSVGPIFWTDFYPDIPSPYTAMMAHLEKMAEHTSITFYSERHWLLGWTRDAEFVNLNSISAMPSVHNGSMLFVCLYCRSIDRQVYIGMCVLLVLVLLATVYSGLHYAIDAYVAYGLVAVIWWFSGRLVRRIHPGIENIALERQRAHVQG